MSLLDVVILIPFAPLFPVLITWWLPWHRWLPQIPNYVLGPYLLYAAFAAWHFKLNWFVVAVSAIAGAAISVVAVFAKTSKPRWCRKS